MCGIDVGKRAFHTLEKCKEFFVWFSGSDECVEKCEEIRCSQFHTSKMWGNWRWAGEMWGIRGVLRGVCRLLANPPFAKRKKKNKASTAASLAAALKPHRVYPWGVELGRGTAVPTVPTQTVSSSVVADRSVFSSKPRLSAFVRSWTS